jgi:hypothetical protein
MGIHSCTVAELMWEVGKARRHLAEAMYPLS